MTFELPLMSGTWRNAHHCDVPDGLVASEWVNSSHHAMTHGYCAPLHKTLLKLCIFPLSSRSTNTQVNSLVQHLQPAHNGPIYLT